MVFYSLLFIVAIVFFSASVASLPFLCEKNSQLAITNKRSLYDKSAKHLALLGFITYDILGVVFLADFYFNGYIARNFIKPNAFDALFISFALLFLVGSSVFFIAIKTNKSTQRVLYRLNCLTGISIIALLAFLSWLFLRTTTLLPAWSYTQIWLDEPYQLAFIAYSVSCLFVGILGAHLLAMLFLIIRRNKDDFGRDYYNVVMGSHAKRAAVATVVCMVLIGILLYLLPASHVKILAIVQELQQYGVISLSNTVDTAYVYVLLGLLFIPLSFLLLITIAKTTVPMQRKSLVFLATLFTLLGFLIFMFHVSHEDILRTGQLTNNISNVLNK